MEEGLIAASFNELPLETRKHLSQMRKEDLEAWDDTVKLARDLRTVGRVMRWIVVSILGFVLGVSMLGESVFKILSWFKTTPPA